MLDSESDQVQLYKQGTLSLVLYFNSKKVKKKLKSSEIVILENAIAKATHERLEKELTAKNQILQIDLGKLRDQLAHAEKEHTLLQRERVRVLP